MLEPLPEPASVRLRLGLTVEWLMSRVISLRVRRVFALPTIVAGIALGGAAVFLTGGTSHGFTLLFFLPILTGAYFYGASGGILTGLAGGLVAAVLPFGGRHGGQLLDTELLRPVIFVLVGGITGTFVTAFARELSGHKRLRDEAARSLWRALEVHNHDSAAHAERVSGYAQAIACELRLPAEQVERVRLAGLLHNIGHLAVPSGSSLTPLVSERVLQEAHEFEQLLPAIRSQHEHWDGSGTPDHLHSHQIPLEARIVKVANAYDNLTHSAGDHPADNPIDALVRIRAQAGSRFDPDIAAALEQLFTRWHVILPPDFFLTSP